MADEKPQMIMVIGILVLIDGIFNILIVLSYALGLISSIIGILCLPILAYPIIVAVMEFILASKLLSNPVKPVKSPKVLAVLMIINILFFNILSLIIGILILVFINDEGIQEFFRRNSPEP